MSDDLYAVLEVAPSASLAEIRAAFRRLARAHHPDLGASSPERMIAINRAYTVLSDPRRRRDYDARRASGAPPPPPASPGPEVAPDVAPEDPPWLIDLERGHDLDDWRQMYAEERQAWEQLLLSRDPADPAIEAALERSKRDQLELENAIRTSHGLASLTMADLDAHQGRVASASGTEATRVGCAAVLLLALGTVLKAQYR